MNKKGRAYCLRRPDAPVPPIVGRSLRLLAYVDLHMCSGRTRPKVNPTNMNHLALIRHISVTMLRHAAMLALLLAAGAHPVAAQVVAPEACADAKDLIRYLTNEGAFIQDAGLKEGIDSLANGIRVRNAACGTPDDQSVPPSAPAPAEPAPTPVPAPTPAFRPADPIPGTDNSATRRDACLLVTEKEAGDAMKQGVVANEADPFGDPIDGVQGCEFDGAGSVAYTVVIYFQGNASFFYDSFHQTAEANGVQAVPGLGDRAFTYVGGNGPGVVVAKGDKLFTMEFNGIGNGTPEMNSLLVLAQQAAGRVH
jgi:hypothetical protein